MAFHSCQAKRSLPYWLPTTLLFPDIDLAPNRILTSAPPPLVQPIAVTLKARARTPITPRHNIPSSYGAVLVSEISLVQNGGAIAPQFCCNAPSLNIITQVCLVYLSVCLIHLVSFVQPNRRDRPNRPKRLDRPDRAGFSLTSRPSRLYGVRWVPCRLSALDDNIASDFPARTKRFLRFTIEFGLDTPGITQR